MLKATVKPHDSKTSLVLVVVVHAVIRVNNLGHVVYLLRNRLSFGRTRIELLKLDLAYELHTLGHKLLYFCMQSKGVAKTFLKLACKG